MYSFSDVTTLIALGRDKNNNLSFYKIGVGEELLEEIQKKKKKGYKYFEELNSVSFTPTYMPSEDECFSLAYNLPNIMVDAIRNPFALAKITGAEFEKYNIKALIMGKTIIKENNEMCLIVGKRILPAQFLSRGCIKIMLKDNTYNKIDTNVIDISDRSHLLIKDDVLYFDSYQYANQILGLTDYYHTASEPALNEFINNVNILGDIDFTEFAQTRVRKLVAIINDSRLFKRFTAEEISAIAKEEQNIDISIENNKIVLDLTNKQQVMLILNCLAENTFITTFSKKLNLTNSRMEI